VYANATSLFEEILTFNVQERVNAFREFLAAIRVRPELLPEPVAYLVGSNIPGSRRLIYGGVTKKLFEGIPEMTTKYITYPGWYEACMAAVEVFCSRSTENTMSMTMTATTIIATNEMISNFQHPSPCSRDDIATTTKQDSKYTDPGHDNMPKSASQYRNVKHDSHSILYSEGRDPPRLMAEQPNLCSKKRRWKRVKVSVPQPPADSNRNAFPQNTPKTIPTFDEVKPILEKANCCFQKGEFSFPKATHLQRRKAAEGRLDSFATAAEFRANLCQYGMDEEKSWGVNERKRLKLWIRCNIVTALNEGDEIPTHERLDDKQEAWALLQKLGYSNTSNSYIKPGINYRKEKSCTIPGPQQNRFDDKVGTAGLYTHLARFGLPIDLGALTRDEQISLQLYLATRECLDEDLETL